MRPSHEYEFSDHGHRVLDMGKASMTGIVVIGLEQRAQMYTILPRIVSQHDAEYPNPRFNVL